MKHKTMKFIARLLMIAFFAICILVFVSCGSTKSTKSKIEETKTKQIKLALKQRADSIRIKDSLSVIEQTSKKEAESTKTETETKTKVVLTPEKDSITGKFKPSKYTEKVNGKTTTEITIDGNGQVTVETNKKTTEEKSSTQSETKETSQTKTKDSSSAKNSTDLKLDQKDDLSRKESSEIKKKNNLPFFLTWWFWIVILIIFIILRYLNKRFFIFDKIFIFLKESLFPIKKEE